MKSSLLWSRRVLSNGMRVLLFPRLSDMTAQLSVAVEYGSNSESEENAGTAHFLEHMLAGGSTRRIQLSRDIEHLGGSSDFFTNHEYTMSFVDIMPEKIAEASCILSKLLFDSSFEETKLVSERKIILNELAEKSDDPRIKINEMLLRCLFKTHPVKRPIDGFPTTVRRLSLNELTKVHQTYYVPQNMILILTGKFADKDVETIFQDFSSAAAQKIVPKKTCFMEKGIPRKEVIGKKSGISQDYLSIGTRTVPSKHRDIHALDMISTLIGSGISSRLFIQVREKHGLTYDIASSHECGLDYGYLHIDCAVKHKHLRKAIKLVHEELSRMRTEKIQEDELAKGREMITGDVLRALNSPEDCPETLADMEIHFNSENALVEYIERVRAVTADDIIEIANRYLQEDSFSTAILTPKA